MSLFTREVQVAVLASGSAGNCTWIGDRHAGVLIDCGLSTRQIQTRLASVGLADARIDAVLLTHEHSDHVGAAAVLARALCKRGPPVPFHATAGTASGIDARCMPDGIELIDAGTPFRVGHLLVEPVPIPHDTLDPVAFRVRAGDVAVGVVTDLGKPTALVARHLAECDVMVLEFNHDEDMLMEGPYPYPLKQRIRGAHGHLSNRQAAQLLGDALRERSRHLVLAHLSEENNTPAKALTAAKEGLREQGALGHVQVQVARQDAALPPIVLSTAAW